MDTRKNKAGYSFHSCRVLVVLSLILLTINGCKPQQIITEKVVTKIDSTKVITLQEELYKKTEEIVLLRAELERMREENTKLQSEISSHIINYDVEANVNPDGQYPKASETITQSKIIFERQIKELETSKLQYSKKIDSLVNVNKNLELSVALLKNENIELKDKTTPTTGFNFRLFIVGVIVGILVCLGVRFLLKKYSFGIFGS